MILWNRCQQQAAFLDKKVPNWYKEIDTSRLNMSVRSRCIVGQCSFFKQEHHLWAERRQLEEAGLDPEVFGYVLLPDYDKLTEYWKTLVRQRRWKDIMKQREEN